MTKEELLEALEPLTIKFKETNVTPIDDIVHIAKVWMDEGEHEDIKEAFSVWDDVMADLVKKHNLSGSTRH